MPSPDLNERVTIGIEWLDATIPDWRDNIDLSILDLASANCCILGQLHESTRSDNPYVAALREHVDHDNPWSDHAENWSRDHGFLGEPDVLGGHSDALTDAWLDALSEAS